MLAGLRRDLPVRVAKRDKPKPIRDLLGVGPGDRVVFSEADDGQVIVEPQTVDIRSLRGSLKPKCMGISDEDMNEAIRQAGPRS